jgi:hypothetical protein
MGARWTVMTGGAAVGGRRGKRGEEGRKRWVVVVASKKEGYVSEGEGRWKKKKKKKERRQRKTMTTTTTTTMYLTWWGVRAATGGGGAAGVGRVIGGCRSFLGMPLLMMTMMMMTRRRGTINAVKLMTSSSMKSYSLLFITGTVRNCYEIKVDGAPSCRVTFCTCISRLSIFMYTAGKLMDGVEGRWCGVYVPP